MEIVIRKRTSCSSRTGLMHFAVRKVRSLHRGTCHRATVVKPGRPTLERIGQRELQCFGKRWSTSVQALADQEKEAPEFIPAEYLADIGDQAAQDMARQMRRAEVEVSGLGVVDTAYVPPAERDEAHDPERMNRSPVCLLHGFDSSSLEFRRLVPLLDRSVRTWAVDVVGWGFSDYSRFLDNSVDSLTPQQKREHLYAFWKQHIGEPMVLVGASLGGTIALDFVLHHPEAVDRVVAIDAQGFVDGLGLMSKLPPALSRVGVGVLRAIWLRQAANKQAYYNKEVFATDDAMKVGRLHTHLPGWTEANMAFMRGGGYAISERLPQVPVPVLVMWGRQDEILDPENAERFLQVLPQARLVWMEECGHCAHLEKPEQCAAEILGFMAS